MNEAFPVRRSGRWARAEPVLGVLLGPAKEKAADSKDAPAVSDCIPIAHSYLLAPMLEMAMLQVAARHLSRAVTRDNCLCRSKSAAGRAGSSRLSAATLQTSGTRTRACRS